ncbi:MAG: glycoside hydrolase family 3 C-terminal domain-containing protein [Cytophagales bacterium]|nr:glycoside hydrolase family 3 C-terminal domain-containing protein [Cytophagales bacterium]MDW8385232.1 glycoside hydrolase family 3 N-terminal domain-containing protein [Flammeovirgaceae bacterium]
MKKHLTIIILIIFTACQENQETTEEHGIKGLYEYDERVEKLVRKMSLEEKIGQMTQLDFSLLLDSADKKNMYQDPTYKLKLNKELAKELISKYYIGSFLNGIAFSSQNWFEFCYQLQEINLETHPNQIPIIYGIDHVHGANYIKEGTVFPHQINQAATFDTSLARNIGEITAAEACHLGHTWNFAPILDIGRNKFWSRFYETYGEDPWLASRMGESFIKGIQEYNGTKPYKMVACAKHFFGYSDPKWNYDRAPIEIAPQTLYEIFLPPFKSAVQAGVRTFMVNSAEINGIPVHANYDILTKLLRFEMGFEGVVVSDWEDIIRLHTVHKIASTPKEAVYLAIMAGIDMSMTPYTTSFCDYLKELVLEGRIPLDRIDLSVKRILKLKFDAGLFEQPYPTDKFFNKINRTEHQGINLSIARQSIVLMKNEKNILPLSKNQKILLAGPAAHSKRHLTGGWSYLWIATQDNFHPSDMLTLYDAMKKEFQSVELATDINTLRSKANSVSAIVLAVGEAPYAEGFGSINDLDLDKDQQLLIETALSTGKPVIVVMIAGRPRTIPTLYDKIHAMLWAGLPGTQGGIAIAEILSGKENPSAKLPFSYPYKQGKTLPYYHKFSEFSPMHPYQPHDERLRFWIAPFGHGLSYTQFEYSDLILSDTIVGAHVGLQTITARVTVTNTGKRDGKETVLWYISDEYGSYTRPVKMLKHFEKQEIKAGESVVFTFIIEPNTHLSYSAENGETLIEAGSFVLQVGGLSKRFVYAAEPEKP